ncbi:MAG: hypothetical protein JJW01_01110 [Alphaproteobacteria bacterium]|nr:hypothetical protein [Rickettsiales bacterium]
MITENKALSVHLERYPEASQFSYNSELLDQTEVIRSICNTALSIRRTSNIKVKIPLSKLFIYCASDLNIEHLKYVLKDEINIQEVEFLKSVEKIGKKKATLNLKKCGSKLGARTKEIMMLVNSGKWSLTKDNQLSVGDITLDKDSFKIEFDLLYKASDSIKYAQLTFGVFSKLTYQAFIALDTLVTPELERLGLVREVVRCVQQSRKNAGVLLGDIVNIAIESETDAIASILTNKEHIHYISSNTLSKVAPNASNVCKHKSVYTVEGIGDIIIKIL